MVRSIASREHRKRSSLAWTASLLAMTWTSIDVRANGDCCAIVGPATSAGATVKFLTLTGNVDLEALKVGQSRCVFLRSFSDVTRSSKLPVARVSPASFSQLERSERVTLDSHQASVQMANIRRLLPWSKGVSTSHLRCHTMPFGLFGRAVQAIRFPEITKCHEDGSRVWAIFSQLTNLGWKASCVQARLTPPHLEVFPKSTNLSEWCQRKHDELWLRDLRSMTSEDLLRGSTGTSKLAPTSVLLPDRPLTTSHVQGVDDVHTSRKSPSASPPRTAAPINPLGSWNRSSTPQSPQSQPYSPRTWFTRREVFRPYPHLAAATAQPMSDNIPRTARSSNAMRTLSQLPTPPPALHSEATTGLESWHELTTTACDSCAGHAPPYDRDAELVKIYKELEATLAAHDGAWEAPQSHPMHKQHLASGMRPTCDEQCIDVSE